MYSIVLIQFKFPGKHVIQKQFFSGKKKSLTHSKIEVILE
jgi:hypothetical protein